MQVIDMEMNHVKPFSLLNDLLNHRQVLGE